MNDNVIVFVVAHVTFGVMYFLTAQKIFDMNVFDKRTYQVPGLVYLADCVSSLVTKKCCDRGNAEAAKAKKTGGDVSWQFLALPVVEFVGLTLALRAMEILGGPLYQTLAGSQIPLTVMFSSALLRKRYTRGQMFGVAVVVCGLAVKAQEVFGGDLVGSSTTTNTLNKKKKIVTAAGVSVVGVVLASISSVSYATRGILMEFLSKSKNAPTGDEMSFAMGTFGLFAFALYTIFVTVPNREEWVLRPMQKSLAKNNVSFIVLVYSLNALARAMMAKCMMKIVKMSGATALSLSNATRSVGVIIFTHVAFCSKDAAKQCLNKTGAISAALVVGGGIVYAYQTAKATSTSSSPKPRGSTKKTAAVKKRTTQSPKTPTASYTPTTTAVRSSLRVATAASLATTPPPIPSITTAKSKTPLTSVRKRK